MLIFARTSLLTAGAMLAMNCIAAPSAYATLIGDTVAGSLSSTEAVTTQFASPATVGAGTEFSGVITDSFGQVFDIEVDVSASSFTVAFTEAGVVLGPGNGNIFGTDLLQIGLADLDFGTPGIIIGLINSAYSCSSPGISCTPVAEGPLISALAFTPDSVAVTIDAMRHGELYTFDIITAQAPEPASWSLLGLGLLTALVMRGRRTRNWLDR